MKLLLSLLNSSLSLRFYNYNINMLNLKEGKELPKGPQFVSRDLASQNQRASRPLGLGR
jgi:hypothetical protein